MNDRREFFYATPAEVLDLLSQVEGNSVLSFTEEPEARDGRQSENIRPVAGGLAPGG